MLDTRSKLRKVVDEKRRHPRLELHCKAVVRGVDGIFTVTDISLGGVFIEPREPVIVKIGQLTDMKIRLPEAANSIQVRVRFVNQTKRGFGCEFINLSPTAQDAIQDCIEAFRYTLPIKSHQSQNRKTGHQKANKKTIQCPHCKRVKSVNLPSKNRGNLKVKLKCSCGHIWVLSAGTSLSKPKQSNTTPERKDVKVYYK